MVVRYNPVLGAVLLLLGLVNLVLGGWLTLLGDFQMALLVGLFLIVLGALYLSRPYFRVDRYGVVVPAPLGPAKREFAPTSSQRLTLADGRLVIADDSGIVKKIPVRRWMARAADWDAVVSSVVEPKE